MLLSIIKNTLSDGSKTYDLGIGEDIINTDATDLLSIMKYMSKLEDCLLQMGACVEIKEEMIRMNR